ncbi:MAG: peptidase S41 [Chitinophagaceae bacterium]|nr:peptidase S41 [Chitinophagaceae bacterium]
MRILIFCFLIVLLYSCTAGRLAFDPAKKYSPEELQKDYTIFQNILEESHPGMYWYTPKDSMDYFFREGDNKLKDSLTEPQFKNILAYILSKIDCGHTTVRSSKKYLRYVDTARLKVFPLSIKFWPDTAVVALNMIRTDSVLKRGTVIKKINGQPISFIIDSLFQFISADGHNLTHKYQSLSNRFNFGQLYSSVFGSSDKYKIDYIDSSGNERTGIVPAYDPKTDTSRRNLMRPFPRQPKLTKRERKKLQLSSVRALRVDSTNETAFMDLNSFGRGFHLQKFFRQSFRYLRKNHINNLVIDVRGNGGGSVNNSTFLSRFLSDHRFKIADSLYAISRKSRYGRYIQNNFWNDLFIRIFSHRKQDGHYHFGYFERHYFKPKKDNHFSGTVYIITGGNSFSATTLFLNSVIHQKNITVVGEETGGGSYGNNAWLIPDVTLPETGIKFRLPLFRLVMNKNYPKNGRGILPDIEVAPTVNAIRQGDDYKMDKVTELINTAKKKNNQVSY